MSTMVAKALQKPAAGRHISQHHLCHACLLSDKVSSACVPEESVIAAYDDRQTSVDLPFMFI